MEIVILNAIEWYRPRPVSIAGTGLGAMNHSTRASRESIHREPRERERQEHSKDKDKTPSRPASSSSSGRPARARSADMRKEAAAAAAAAATASAAAAATKTPDKWLLFSILWSENYSCHFVELKILRNPCFGFSCANGNQHTLTCVKVC